jgi:eukaryotic-like serine/threonine-protein kinase
MSLSLVEPQPVSQLNPEVPPPLETVIHKALEKDRDLRYQHASEMRADLSRLLRDSSSEPATLTESAKLKAAAPSVTPSRKKWALGAGTFVALLLAGFLWWRHQRPASAPGDQSAQTAVAVLPFQNADSDKDIDYLGSRCLTKSQPR